MSVHDRHGGASPGPRRQGRAVVGLAAMLVLASCGRGAGTPAVTGTAGAPAATVDLASPRPVADDPDPVVRAGASGRMVACDGPVSLGGWARDFGGPSVASPDPAAALDAFTAQGLFGLPATGYRQAATDAGRVLFTYDVEDRPRIAVVVADAGATGAELTVTEGWVVETFATCDPAEYAPSTDDELRQRVWTDREGNRVPTSTITSFTGPEHCDWQSVTFLYLEERQYLRDPEGRLFSEVVSPYDGNAALPSDAVYSGYRLDDDQLWLAADGSIAYLVSADRVEAWPSASDPVGCA